MTQPRKVKRADIASRRISSKTYIKKPTVSAAKSSVSKPSVAKPTRRNPQILLYIGGGLLVMVMILMLLMLIPGKESADTAPHSNPISDLAQQAETAPAPDPLVELYPDTEADIVVAGDIMCLAGQLSAAQVSGGWDFTYAFARIAPVLQGADFAIGNLEVPLAGKEHGVTAYNQPGNPILNAPMEFIDAVQEAGFDMVVTANNHAFDKGDFGREKTIAELDARGIYHSGTYVSEYMQQNTPIVEINHISTAFLSYAQFVNTGTEAYKSSGQLYKMNLLDPVQIKADIASARDRGAELVILYVHWGAENTNTPNAYQLETAQQLADAGADIIIGSHSHTIQPAEYLTTADGRKVLVIYSMGNLVSSMPRDINQDTLLLNLHIARTDGVVSLTDASYMCITGGSNDGKSFAALPSRLTIERGHQTGRMRASIERINAILGNTLREEACFPYAQY